MPLDSLTNGPFLGTSRNPYSYEKIEQTSRDIQTTWYEIQDIRDQLNLFDDTSQDNYLFGLDLATRMAIEDYLGMAIFPVSYKVYYGAYNGMTGTQVCLDLPQISQDNQGSKGVTINTVGYYTSDAQPVFTLVNKTQYYYDPTGNKIVVNGIPDEINQVMTNPIVVTYTLGASPLAQYPVIKQAGLLLLTHLYNNRSNTIQGALNEIPFGVKQLLMAYKPLRM